MNRGGTRKKIMTTKKKRKPYEEDTIYETKRARLNDGEGDENDISDEMLEAYNKSGHRCDYCQRTADCNKLGEKEELLFCKDCRAKAHPSCMEYSKSLAERARHSPWQCIDCKTCSVCCDSGDPSTMLFCDACDKGYHMECHKPLVAEKPSGKWVCNRCEKESEGSTEKIVIENGASCLPTPSESPVQFDQTSVSLPSKVPIIANVLSADQIPDAFDWTIEDVVKFFKDVGFQSQAEVFREQEIDGKSLLLLKRSDVLSGLSLKLGPALKIYTHVQRLQNNSKFM